MLFLLFFSLPSSPSPQDVRPGGRFRPPDCAPRHRVALLVPYRDREQHLRVFLRHMHPILRRQQLQYAIFVINQVTGEPDELCFFFYVGVQPLPSPLSTMPNQHWHG